MNIYADGTPATTQSSTIHIETTYNAYGVALSSTQTTTTKTTTTRDVITNGTTKSITSTTTTVQTVNSSWRGGSLKADKMTGTSDTTGSDGSSAHSDFWADYSYNDKGQLAGASGGAHTTGDRGKDANGQALGTYTSDSIDSYEIRNGVALKTGSTTTGQNFGVDGKKTGDFTETSTNEYSIVGGNWQLMKTTSVSSETDIDGSTTNTTTTTAYTRDENGVVTGVTQTKTGTMVKTNGKSGDQLATVTYNIENYVATFVFDSQQGWYLAKESYDWKSQPPSGGNQKNSPQGQGAQNQNEKEQYKAGWTFNQAKWDADTAGLSQEAKDLIKNDNFKTVNGQTEALVGSNYVNWQP